ncbi:HmuY family protein [Hahella ganghwensis]|uniref:HmuY family protein n=1 Tax=Hahella ganghwensis TaxID=286420 RepID=UPI00036B6295|nr:HmuY family protein [Hahella ganghwensis]
MENINHRFPSKLTHYLAAGSLASIITLTGCSSGNSTPPEESHSDSDLYTSAVIDASSNENYTYYNLETGQTVALTDAQAATSDAWHIAFRRLSVKLNGGSSGSGNVRGALAATQDDFYNDGEPNANVFLNATTDSEEEHLLADVDTGTLTFQADSQSSAIATSGTVSGTTMDMGWYNYNRVTHGISVNTDNAWLLRSNSGDSYARFHASDLTYTPGGNLDVTFDFDVQSDGDTTFNGTATFNASVPVSGGSACFDFDTDTEVDCATQTSWDLKLEIDGRDWNLWTNSGVSGNGNGGALGDPYTYAELFDDAQYDNATSPTGQGGHDIRGYYSIDSSAGVFEENSWYAYNLSGQHKIWPNFRVYVIDTDATNEASSKYKLQITNYHSEGGASGHPNIRFVAIEETEE